MAGRLHDEVALVTGSTRGLGREIARLFAEEGARVVVTGRNEQRGGEIVDSITAAGGEALFVPADLGKAWCHSLVAGLRLVASIPSRYSAPAF